VLPSGDGGLKQAIDIQSDALRNAALDADELSRELEVIIQEANRKLDSPDAVCGETLYELLFNTHRMRRWRIGTEEGLRKLTHDAVRSYYETRYAPGRVVVALVGDLDTDEAVDLARKAYGDWDRPTVDIEGSPPEPSGYSSANRILHGDVKRPIAALGWRTVGTLHEDTPALDVAASLLGSGRGSRLYRSVRMPGLASSVRAGHYTPTEVGVFDLTLAADAAKIDDAIERSVEAVARLAAAGPDMWELDRARALLEMRWARALESMDSRASALCDAEALGGYELLDELYERTKAVTPDQVVNVMGRYLSPDTSSLVLYLPEGGSTRLDDGGWPIGVEAQSEVSEPSSHRPPEKVAVASGAGGDQVEYRGEITCCSYEGVDMLVRSKPGSGLVSLGLEVPDVPALETKSNAGISRLFARSTMRGAGGRTGEEIAIAAESLGGGIVASSSGDGLGWGITVPPDALERAAELIRSVALEPTLAAADIAKERSLQASDARRSQDDMFRHPTQRVLGEAFSGDAYGLPVLGEPETLESLPETAVQEWGAAIGDRRAVVVAVGDMERVEMLRALSPLADWPASVGSSQADRARAEFVGGKGSEQREKAQTALAMAFPSKPADSPDRFPLAVIGSLLSGLAGRLFEELREKRSLAYTVAAIPWLRRRAGVMLTYIATSPDREDEARDCMLRELERLIEEPASELELDRARNYSAGLVEMRQQNASSIGSEILSAWQTGVLDEVTEIADRLRAVKPEEIVRVAAETFGSELRAEYVVRGR